VSAVLLPLRSGSEVDGFRIAERIHAGGMGNIYRVTKPGFEMPMIMKVPRVGPNEPTEGIISFETEAMIVPALRGPHVPKFIAAGDLARTPYLVTEWVEGQTLDQRLAGGSIPVDEVIRVGAAIADALHDLHQQDVVHLDVKPSNVIMKGDGSAVLIDFGFSHHARYPDLLAEEKRFGAGSAPYVSPEQLLGTRNDPRSDIFSLGVVLYEMATGTMPFGELDSDVRNRLWLDPVPPALHTPAVRPWLQEIILRCLEPSAVTRYQSAAHVAFDLRNPEQVRLTARAAKSQRAGLLRHVRRFLDARREHGHRLRFPKGQVSSTPIIMVAVDTAHPDDERQPALQRTTEQILSLSREFRLICVSVIEAAPLMDNASVAESASGIHLEHLIRLRHWVEPLRMPQQRLSLHVIQAPKPANALIDFARQNNVDLMVLGVPGADQPDRSSWQSVASSVSANAPCSVHVVRYPTRAT
jgi:eukaryotic-like serine/threonine-protein kinase